MDAPLLYVFTVAADGSILQMGRVGSLEAAGTMPAPEGGSVQVFSEPPAAVQGIDRWNVATRAFEPLPPLIAPPPPAPTFDELKAAKMDAMQDAKAAALSAMVYAGHTVTISSMDVINAQGALAMLRAQGDGATLRWEVETNVFIDVDAAWLQGSLDAGTVYVTACYAHASELYLQITSAADAAALAAIDPSAGWPLA